MFSVETFKHFSQLCATETLKHHCIQIHLHKEPEAFERC